MGVPLLPCFGTVVWKSSALEPHQAALQNYGFHWVLVTLQVEDTRGSVLASVFTCTRNWEWQRDPTPKTAWARAGLTDVCQVNAKGRDQMSRGQVSRYWGRGSRVTQPWMRVRCLERHLRGPTQEGRAGELLVGHTEGTRAGRQGCWSKTLALNKDYVSPQCYTPFHTLLRNQATWAREIAQWVKVLVTQA